MSIYLIVFLVLAASVSFAALAFGLVLIFFNMEEKHPIAAKILGSTTFMTLLYLLALAVLKLKSSGFHIDLLQN